MKVGDQKIVIGILSSEKCTHMSLDLVFEKEFELSHNWKHGSVYFCGYFTTAFEEEYPFDCSLSSVYFFVVEWLLYVTLLLLVDILLYVFVLDHILFSLSRLRTSQVALKTCFGFLIFVF